MEAWRAELYSNELYHHGIKGMKWGVRRFQNADGSYTDAGRKRYGYSEKVSQLKDAEKSAKKAYKKAESSGSYKEAGRTKMEYEFAKKDRQDQQIREKMAQEKGKSEARKKYEEEYKKKGMTDEEAAIAAYRRDKATKIALAVGGVAIASVVAYAGYQYYKNNVDTMIKSGVGLQNISKYKDRPISDAFYASYKKTDMMKYRGMYGGMELGGMGLNPFAGKPDIYKMTVNATDNIKVASPNSARKVLNSALKGDDQFRKDLAKQIKGQIDAMEAAAIWNGGQKDNRLPVLQKAYDHLNSGKEMTLKDYHAVNIVLPVRSDPNSTSVEPVIQKYYSHLKAAGYDAIDDINDMKYSGYSAKKPVIVFNDKKLSIGDVTQVDEKQLKKDFVKGYGMAVGQKLAPYAAAGAAVGAGVKVAEKAIERKSDAKIVAEYKKEHPNTEMSYNEILRSERRRRGY